jgi:hypothetical protein
MAPGAGRCIGLFLALSCMAAVRAGGQINTHGRPLNEGEGRFARYALWRDGNRWHFRTMTKDTEGRFSGSIEVRGGEFTRVTEYWVEHTGPRGVLFAGNPKRNLIRFDFASKESIDGLDFRVKGKEPELVFTLLAGEKAPAFEPGAIFIGRSGLHPSSNPFHLPARDK